MNYRDPFEHLRKLQPLADPFQSPAMRGFLAWQDRLKAMTSLQTMVLPGLPTEAGGFTSIADALKPHPALAELIRAKPLGDEIRLITKNWADAYAPLIGATKLESLASSLRHVHGTSWASSMSLLSGLATPPQLGIIPAVMGPHDALSVFVRRTAERAASAGAGPTRAYALSVELAGAQVRALDETAASLSDSAAGATTDDTETTIDHAPNLFDVQQGQILATPANLDKVDIEHLLAGGGPSSTRLFGAGAHLTGLVAAINKEESLREARSTFTCTADWVSAMQRLPLIVAQDEQSLREYVMALFTVLYEGAGSTPLRFHVKGAGPLATEECEPLWILKMLRNKWFCHDPEHGDAGKQRRSKRALRETLVALGQANGPPRTPGEFESLQSNLVGPLCDMMQTLLERTRTPLA